ncbi:MAG: hypothetical protein ACE5IR_27540, partial [bacterium]
ALRITHYALRITHYALRIKIISTITTSACSKLAVENRFSDLSFSLPHSAQERDVARPKCDLCFFVSFTL